MRSAAAIGRLFLGALLAIVRRPSLGLTALRQARALAPTRWWTTAPYLPIPPRDYLAFRQVTLSGDADQLPSVQDLVTWLEWCRSMRALPR